MNNPEVVDQMIGVDEWADEYADERPGMEEMRWIRLCKQWLPTWIECDCGPEASEAGEVKVQNELDY